ncbi:MAG: hypothetical protein K5925_00040 [Bacilli bacterium]|nr:hypothetical protein [Bacilli bacterium]
MEEKRLKYQFKLLSETADSYHFEVGAFKDGKLEGLGKIEYFNNDKKHSFVGFFSNGELNGLGVHLVDDDIVEYGVYDNGQLVDLNDFLAGASFNEIVELNFDKTNYKNVREYRKEGISVVFFEKVEAYSFMESKTVIADSKRKVIHFVHEDWPCFYIDIVSEKGYNSPFKFFYFGDIEKEFEEMLSKGWNHHILMPIEIKIIEGKEEILENLYSGDHSVKLYLPRSIKKLGPNIITPEYNRDHKVLVEVFYQGTKEEWNAIIKGETVTHEREDWYGYYYHNTERYEKWDEYIPWVTNYKKLTIHCSDSEIVEYPK